MSGLADAAGNARAQADVSINPADHALANALEGALAAERAKGHEPADTTGIPSAVESGYVANIPVPLEEPNPNAPHAPGTPGWWMEG
jgi:hypothetical protein